jgi:hypothetical protein
MDQGAIERDMKQEASMRLVCVILELDQGLKPIKKVVVV